MSSLGARLNKLGAHYLGDGAYVYLEVEGGSVVLLTSDGISVTNQVVLDPETLRAFLGFLRDKKIKP